HPAINSGELAVRWIPLGELLNRPDIVRSIFNSKDPLEELIKYHKTKSYDKKLTQQYEKAETNLRLSSDIEGFPTLV
ncbi:DsbC family protein, partial [Francisella tularensis subsp. holarctica]|nr:DsbC family protein [Francisella tularensis subsp. holarctica]